MPYNVSMDIITNFFSSALYDPVAQGLKDVYNNNLAGKVSQLSEMVTGPINTRISELENTPGVSSNTVKALKELGSGALTTAQNPSTSLSTISAAIPTIQTRFNILSQQATAEATQWKQDQTNKAEMDLKQQEEDKSFNIYRLMNTIKTVFIQYIFYFILLALALFGGSLMSNRAILRSWGFRLYYFVYGTLLFPLSYFIAVKEYYMGDKNLPKFFAILAPLVNKKNHMLVTNVLFFPFTYNHPDDIEEAEARKRGALAHSAVVSSDTPDTPT